MKKQTLERMQKGEITPLDAVREIDEETGGISGVMLRKGLTIESAAERTSLQINGLNKKQAQKMLEFAVLAYLRAKENGSHRPGEVHIGKGLSSKHYAGAFRDYARGLVEKYS